MNRITRIFNDIRKARRKALVGFLTAGDPNMARSERDIRSALRNGVDIMEIGVPFSDPTADGPTIQAAGLRALRAGANLRSILAMIGRIRKDFDNPIVLFSYANPLFAYGYEHLCADASAVGVDGLLIVDIPNEESDEITEIARKRGIFIIPLIAPTTSEKRARSVLAKTEGFVYYILVKGVTGARKTMPAEAMAHLSMLRRCTDLPVVVGFGISSGSQARRAAGYADGVVVGSALIEAARAGRLARLVRELAAGVRG
jgi:tryptophan synthase alpha chain